MNSECDLQTWETVTFRQILKRWDDVERWILSIHVWIALLSWIDLDESPYGVAELLSSLYNYPHSAHRLYDLHHFTLIKFHFKIVFGWKFMLLLLLLLSWQWLVVRWLCAEQFSIVSLRDCTFSFSSLVFIINRLQLFRGFSDSFIRSRSRCRNGKVERAEQQQLVMHLKLP